MLAARAAAARGAEVLETARAIWLTEREQARRLRGGETLRVQLAFDEYLARRERDHSFSLRAPAPCRRRDRGVAAACRAGPRELRRRRDARRDVTRPARALRRGARRAPRRPGPPRRASDTRRARGRGSGALRAPTARSRRGRRRCVPG